jgi:putative sterol carrier protein
MAQYPFLSSEWVEEARKIRSEYEGRAGTVPHQMRMNLVVIDVPFGEGSIDAHMDTTDGSLRLETGHIDPVDLKVTLDYDTAKAILVDGNPQVGMQAFMAGKVKVEGDMAKLMMMQGVPQDDTALEVATRLRDITA